MRRSAARDAVRCCVRAAVTPGQSPPRTNRAHAIDTRCDARRVVLDSDGDGLCDTTEDEFGTDPERRDSDGDGMPDLIELGNGFDATDPSSARRRPGRRI